MNGEKENGTMKKVCKLCGTSHDELRNCPDLVPGYPQSADGKADRLDQLRADHGLLNIAPWSNR